MKSKNWTRTFLKENNKLPTSTPRLSVKRQQVAIGFVSVTHFWQSKIEVYRLVSSKNELQTQSH